MQNALAVSRMQGEALQMACDRESTKRQPPRLAATKLLDQQGHISRVYLLKRKSRLNLLCAGLFPLHFPLLRSRTHQGNFLKATHAVRVKVNRVGATHNQTGRVPGTEAPLVARSGSPAESLDPRTRQSPIVRAKTP